MVAPPNVEQGKPTTRPSNFNGQSYGWWKNCINDYINTKETELWDVILYGCYIHTKDVIDREINKVIPKTRKEYNEVERKNIEKNYKAKKILVHGIG